MHMTDRPLYRLVDRPGMSLKVYYTVRLKVQAENVDHGLMQATGWLRRKSRVRHSFLETSLDFRIIAPITHKIPRHHHATSRLNGTHHVVRAGTVRFYRSFVAPISSPRWVQPSQHARGASQFSFGFDFNFRDYRGKKHEMILSSISRCAVL